MTWTEQPDHRFVRTDGATVVMNIGPSQLQWIAFEPDPSQAYLAMKQGTRGLIGPRRWKTAEAAMKAVDKKFPKPPQDATP